MSDEACPVFADVSAPPQLVPFRRFLLYCVSLGGISSELVGMGFQLITGQCLVVRGIDETLSGMGAFSSIEHLERSNANKAPPDARIDISWIDEAFTTSGALAPTKAKLALPGM